MASSSTESSPQENTILSAAIESLASRHEQASAKADTTAQRLGYDIAGNPEGDYRDRIETLRIEKAVADAIREDIQLVGGYASGLFVLRPTE